MARSGASAAFGTRLELKGQFDFLARWTEAGPIG